MKGGKNNNQTITVRYKKGKDCFELICKPGSVKPYREGKQKNLDKVLLVELVFKNASKADKAKSSELKKVFGTDDQMECIKIILAKGTFPLTKTEIQEMIRQKEGEILNYMHKYYYDSTKNPPRPHPETRFKTALEQMRYKIDPHEPVDRQIKAIDKKIIDVLPVKRMPIPDLVIKEALEKEYIQKESKNNNYKNNKGKSSKKGKGKNKTDRFGMS